MMLLAIVCLLVWLYLLWARGEFWRVRPEVQAPAPAQWPEIAVIIPARNEAGMLPQTLPTLLKCDYPGSLQIILVDDLSEDGTSHVAGQLAAQGLLHHLTVIQSSPLPAGWKGKVWAMQCGLNYLKETNAAPRYVLFTDADIAYAPDALRSLAARAEAGGHVLTSLMVRLNCMSFAEQFLIPAFVYFFAMLYPFGWVSSPRNPLAAAAGGCMLTRYDALQQAGGMEPIKNALIDDCAFARLMKKQGSIHLSLTQKVRSLRSYPEVSDIRHMVARTAFDQLGYSWVNLAAVTLGMVLVFLLPVLLAFLADGSLLFVGLIAWVIMATTYLPMLRFYGCPLWYALLFPVIGVYYMVFTLDSALQYRRGKGGSWKGRMQA